jgi:hydrophobe/amphiphile efflux-3 (HAE3) family protein
MPEQVQAAALLALVGGVALLALGVWIAVRRLELVVGRPRGVLAVLLALSLLAAAALVQLRPLGLRLQLDPSTESLLPAHDPARPVYEQAIREFGDDEIFAIAMETEDGVFTQANLTTLKGVHEAIARLPGVRRVQSLADVVTFHYDAEADWIDVGRLFDEVPADAAALAALRARALTDPLLRRTVISEDGRTAGISVRFVKMTDRQFIDSGLDQRIARLLADARQPGIHFHIAGRPHAKASVYRGMVRDLAALIPLSVLVQALVLAVATGTRRGVVLPLANVLVGIGWTFGMMAACGRPLTVLSCMLGPELIAIGSVFGIHLLAGFDEERRGPGDAREIVARTLEHERLAIALSSATTQIGFGSLCFTDVPAIFEFGAFAVFGVGAVTFLALTGLPAVLVLLPPRRDVSALPKRMARWSERYGLAIERGLAAIHAASARHSGRAILAGAVAGAVAVAAIPNIVIDTDYLSFFGKRSQVRRDFEAVDRLLAGAIPIYVVASGSGPGTFREPEALRALERLQAHIDRVPGVSRTLSMVDFLREMNRALERDAPGSARIPDDRASVTEMLQLAPKDEMERFVNINASRANLIVRTGAVGSAAIRTLTAALEDAIRAELPEGLSAAPTANAILLARGDDSIANSQLQSITGAATTIFLLVTVALRSLKLGVIAMIPNVLPVAMYFGLLGLGVAPLSLPTSLIGAVALGIAVDDTVHFLVRYRRERRAGLEPAEAARITGLRVGTPIATTAIMLTAGFGTIALSSFATLRQFGLLFAATVVICLAAELVLMPALLVRTRA